MAADAGSSLSLSQNRTEASAVTVVRKVLIDDQSSTKPLHESFCCYTDLLYSGFDA